MLLSSHVISFCCLTMYQIRERYTALPDNLQLIHIYQFIIKRSDFCFDNCTTIMKAGYSQIRNRALAHAFSYMNLIEGWGTGVPRLLREMKEYGLVEPEFVDMEVALRINLFRAWNAAQDGAEKVLEGAGETQDNALEMRKIKGILLKCAESALKRELSAQEKIIIESIVENGNITSAQLMERLNLKKRRVQVILER